MNRETTLAPPRRTLHLDVETYSVEPLPKCGVYRYSGSSTFEIMLLSYAFDDDPIVTIDMASGEQIPDEFLSALEDPSILKVAHNASFERVCFSRYLGRWLDPHQWRCSMVMASYNTLPLSLANVALALKLTETKMEEGKDLIRYFSTPCKPTKTNGGRMRNLPGMRRKNGPSTRHTTDRTWKRNGRSQGIDETPLPESEWNCTLWIRSSTTAASVLTSSWCEAHGS